MRAQQEAPLRGLGNIRENAQTHHPGIDMPKSKERAHRGIDDPTTTGKLKKLAEEAATSGDLINYLMLRWLEE